MPLDVTDDESALIKCLVHRVTSLPDDVEEEMERAADQRAYFKDCMLRPNRSENVEIIATNYAYRYTAALVNDVLAVDPTAKIHMRDKLWGPDGVPEQLLDYGETLERLANYMGDLGDFASAAREVAWDAHTVPVGFIKLIWSEDFHKDPLGAPLHGPQQKNATYKRLYEAYKNNDFDKDSEEYFNLVRLSDSLKTVSRNQIEGAVEELGGATEELTAAAKNLVEGGLVNPKYLPNVPLFQKFDFEVLDFEDVRWDWKVESPRGWWDADWVAHRVPMTREDVVSKFNLSSEEAMYLEKTEEADESDDTHERREDVDENESENTIDVWEMQDNVTGQIHVFTEEYGALLDSYEPTVSWSKFFTVFPIMFNTTPDGFVGVSDVDLLRPLQDEINDYRTMKRQALKAKIPKYACSAHLVTDDGDLDALRDAGPYSITKVGINSDDLAKVFVPIVAKDLDVGIIDNSIGSATVELQAMGGRPLAALGAAQKGVTATQTAFTSNQLGEMVSARRLAMTNFMTLIYTAMLEMLMQTMDEVQVRSIVGPGAVWPPEGRQSGFMQMNLEVAAHLESRPDSQRFLADLITLTQFAATTGRMPSPEILPDITKEHLGLDIPIQKWFPIPPQPAMGSGTPGPAPGALGNAPTDGAPPMASLPGNAQTAQNAAQAGLA